MNLCFALFKNLSSLQRSLVSTWYSEVSRYEVGLKDFYFATCSPWKWLVLKRGVTLNCIYMNLLIQRLYKWKKLFSAKKCYFSQYLVQEQKRNCKQIFVWGKGCGVPNFHVSLLSGRGSKPLVGGGPHKPAMRCDNSCTHTHKHCQVIKIKVVKRVVYNRKDWKADFLRAGALVWPFFSVLIQPSTTFMLHFGVDAIAQFFFFHVHGQSSLNHYPFLGFLAQCPQ